jgi:hypothetical protein
VKLTHALNKELQEASWRITEVESLSKQHEEVIRKLKKENATLKRMVQSHDELIMEIVAETRPDWMGEDDHEDDDEDDGNDEVDDNEGGGDATTLLAAAPPAAASLSCRSPASSPCSWGILRRDRWGCLMTWLTWPMLTMMWTSGFLRMEVMIMIESLSLGLMFRIKNKSLGVILDIEL